MPSFDDPSRKQFGPLFDLKQVAPTSPTHPRVVATPTTPTSKQAAQQPAAPLAPSPAITRQLTLEPLAKVTRQLSTTLISMPEPSTPRLPLVIKGGMQKLALGPTLLPPAKQRKKRRLANLAVMGFLLLVIMLTFFTTTALGQDIEANFQPWQFTSNLFRNMYTTSNSLVMQATAIAAYHQRTDGYNPFIYSAQAVNNGQYSLGWPIGQCTYWANLRYHALTGYWVSWSGNADQWVAGASVTPGWHVSQTPHVPAIMVLMPGVQTAGGYGHVAVVEGLNGDGTVHTSNMNWYSNGGGFNRYSNADFTPGPGVYFIWHD